jgi:2-keto-3-deoxy-L-rhamnonate aldolase RhmA
MFNFAGRAGEFEHPTLVEAIEETRDSCLKHGLARRIHMRSLALAKYWKERGMLFLSTGSETTFLFDRASEGVKALASRPAPGSIRFHREWQDSLSVSARNWR